MPSIWGTTLDEHRALVLDRLVGAFGELVAERGLEATTLAAVAERAGIARSAVYNHVKDKHDLLLAHTARALDEAHVRLRAALDAEVEPDAKLARYVHVTFTSWASRPAAGVDVVLAMTEEEQARFRAQLAPMMQLLGQVVAAGVEAGRYGAGPPEVLTRFVASVLEGHRMAVSSGRLDPEAAAAEVTDLLLHGLTGAAGGGGAAGDGGQS